MLIFNTLNYSIRQFGRFLFGNLDVFHSETWTYLIQKFGQFSFGNLDSFHSAIWTIFIRQFGHIFISRPTPQDNGLIRISRCEFP